MKNFATLISKKKRKINQKAQVTLFVIIAILIIAAIGAGIYYSRNKAPTTSKVFFPIQEYLTSCLQQKAEDGIAIIGLQGGYINPPTFQQGSGYMPFSSQFNFLGTGVPYWFYLDRNGIPTQQVPTLSLMQSQLADYINEEIKTCDLSDFESQGFIFTLPEKITSEVTIRDNNIDLTLDYPIIISKDTNQAELSAQKITLDSKLGKMYKEAKNIYNYQISKRFLEEYSLDILTLYAPTTDVEISCTPITWLKSDINSNIKDALQANIGAIKFQGNYYTLKSPESKYFVVPLSVDDAVNLIYTPDLPTKLEIWGGDSASNDEVIIAKPVGIQPGLSALGFCYINYHFVYDLAFPVLIQIFDSKEFFQFPVVAFIAKNTINKSESDYFEIKEEICNNQNTDLRIVTSDFNENPVKSKIYFKCLNEQCALGETEITSSGAILDTKSPQCIGSYFLAEADGYAEAKVQEDVIWEKEVKIYLQKLYELPVEVYVSNAPIQPNDLAVISFVSDSYSTSVVYPQQKTVKLKEGYYDVSIDVYSQGSIVVPGYQDQQCYDAPASGLLGLLGIEQEKCIDINMPSQTLNQILSSSGTTAAYMLEYEMQIAQKIVLNSQYIPAPKDINELQDIYLTKDDYNLELTLE